MRRANTRTWLLALAAVIAAALLPVLSDAAAQDKKPAGPAAGAPAGSGPAGKIAIDVPPAVQATILAESGGGKILDFRRHTDEGQTMYGVTLQVKGAEYQLIVGEDGRLIRKGVAEEEEERDVRVPYEQVPQAVKTALVDELRGGQIKGILRRERKTVFTTVAVIDGNPYTIRLDIDGKLVSKEYGGEVEEEQEERAEGEQE